MDIQIRKILLKMSPAQIVRHFFPDVSDTFVEHIIWEETGWPAFFPAGDPVEHFISQVREAHTKRVGIKVEGKIIK